MKQDPDQRTVMTLIAICTATDESMVLYDCS